MTIEQQSGARRRLLKSISAVGGIAVSAKAIPGSWTRPVVDSVLLPVHAQTSKDACGPVECNLAISMNYSTNDDDWDLVISLNGQQLSGKSGNIACLVHAGDETPPLNTGPELDFRETITNPSGFLAVGNYRVFARLANSQSAPSGDTLTGSITTCDDNTNYTVNPNELNIGDTITIRNLEVTAGGSVNIL